MENRSSKLEWTQYCSVMSTKYCGSLSYSYSCCEIPACEKDTARSIRDGADKSKPKPAKGHFLKSIPPEETAPVNVSHTHLTLHRTTPFEKKKKIQKVQMREEGRGGKALGSLSNRSAFKRRSLQW
jgi:hypothetical protein